MAPHWLQKMQIPEPPDDRIGTNKPEVVVVLVDVTLDGVGKQQKHNKQ